MIYYTCATAQPLIDLQAKISQNCGFPKDGTQKWDNVQKAVNQEMYFIQKPVSYNKLQQATMLSGIDLTGITEQERNKYWFPPEVDTEKVTTQTFTLFKANI
tara:strand:- start:282 stop:587 length:306 start_codon:yes stop_codon:yes gene_type:complete